MDAQSSSNGSLLRAVQRYTAAHAGPNGVARTPIDGLSLIRASKPSGIEYAISRPLACLVLQGSKQVTMGTDVFQFSGGMSLLINGDVPNVSQITQATEDKPYFSLVLDLDLAVIAELVVEMKLKPSAPTAPIQIEPTDMEVAGAALRLMRLIERPGALPVLQAQLLRELPLLVTGRQTWCGATSVGMGQQPHPTRGACGQLVAGRVCTTAARREIGGGGGHESVFVLSALQGRDIVVASSVSEAVAPDRSEKIDDW